MEPTQFVLFVREPGVGPSYLAGIGVSEDDAADATVTWCDDPAHAMKFGAYDLAGPSLINRVKAVLPRVIANAIVGFEEYKPAEPAPRQWAIRVQCWGQTPLYVAGIDRFDSGRIAILEWANTPAKALKFDKQWESELVRRSMFGWATVDWVEVEPEAQPAPEPNRVLAHRANGQVYWLARLTTENTELDGKYGAVTTVRWTTDQADALLFTPAGNKPEGRAAFLELIRQGAKALQGGTIDYEDAPTP